MVSLPNCGYAALDGSEGVVKDILPDDGIVLFEGVRGTTAGPPVVK
jgi:hypothetical protein